VIVLGLYATAAFVTGAALYLFAEFRRAPGAPAHRCSGLCAVVAGILWPVLLIGAAQFGLVAALSHGLSRTASPEVDAPAVMTHQMA
jgi:hypothetical protein